MDKKFELAKKAYDNAFAKYSKFQVGAVVVLKNGEYIIGSNVENASYGLCIHHFLIQQQLLLEILNISQKHCRKLF